MKKIFPLLIVFLIISCQRKEVSPKVIDLIKPLRGYTSFYALDTIPNLITEKLKSEATEDELEIIINKENSPYVKAVAIEALMRKNKEYTFKLFEENLNSEDSIVFRTECLRDKLSIPCFIFTEGSFSSEYLSVKQAEINKKHFFEILFDQRELNVKLIDELVFWIPNKEEYYLKIREAIIQNRSKYLLRALGKFKKKQDIELIKSFGKEAFLAIREFPDDAFLLMFEKYKSEEGTVNYKWAKGQYRK